MSKFLIGREEIRWEWSPVEQGGGLGGSQMAQVQEEMWHWEGKEQQKCGEMRTGWTVKKAGVAQGAMVGKGRREGKTHQKGDLAAVEQT